jgi:hypothetical protein
VISRTSPLPILLESEPVGRIEPRTMPAVVPAPLGRRTLARLRRRLQRQAHQEGAAEVGSPAPTQDLPAATGPQGRAPLATEQRTP